MVACTMRGELVWHFSMFTDVLQKACSTRRNTQKACINSSPDAGRLMEIVPENWSLLHLVCIMVHIKLAAGGLGIEAWICTWHKCLEF